MTAPKPTFEHTYRSYVASFWKKVRAQTGHFRAEKHFQGDMAQTLPIIGISPEELPWIRRLVQLLRYPHPEVPELTRQALDYLQDMAERYDFPQTLPPKGVRSIPSQ